MVTDTTVTLYEITILCPACYGRYKEIVTHPDNHYRKCELCGCYFAKMVWGSPVKEIEVEK